MASSGSTRVLEVRDHSLESASVPHEHPAGIGGCKVARDSLYAAGRAGATSATFGLSRQLSFGAGDGRCVQVAEGSLLIEPGACACGSALYWAVFLYM